jgi:hypothetical protein
MTDDEGKRRAVKILARSLVRDLQARGFDLPDVISLAGELIAEVTRHVAGARAPRRHQRLA